MTHPTGPGYPERFKRLVLDFSRKSGATFMRGPFFFSIVIRLESFFQLLQMASETELALPVVHDEHRIGYTWVQVPHA